MEKYAHVLRRTIGKIVLFDACCTDITTGQVPTFEIGCSYPDSREKNRFGSSNLGIFQIILVGGGATSRNALQVWTEFLDS
ncbi:MAG: hypothetical protein GF410_03820 [Chitinivibrionales bacterium]|nr:hypothetical protein [Chitinivibrionales bacterium]